MIYDYKQAIREDIKEYIKLNDIAREPDETDEQYAERLEDELWTVVEVTGNGPYYYKSELECGEMLAFNLDLFFLVADEWGLDLHDEKLRTEPAQYMDAVIRCYLLRECIAEVIEEAHT